MGIDLLDVTLRIEKEFNLKVSNDDWSSLVRDRQRPDITAGDLLDLIRCRCRPCGYDLRGHTDQGRCPECGVTFDFSAATLRSDWEVLRNLLANVMKIEIGKIQKESLLVRDLGMD